MSTPVWRNETWKLAARVDLTTYERSHAKKPKGSGLWFFGFGRDPDSDMFQFNGSYKAALKAAQTEAKKRGESVIHVMP